MKEEIYKIHEGILLSPIFGRFFLIAVRAAWEECPHIQEVNEYGAFCWKRFETGCHPDEIVSDIISEYHVTEAEARTGLMQFMDQLYSCHYLIPSNT